MALSSTFTAPQSAFRWPLIHSQTPFLCSLFYKSDHFNHVKVPHWGVGEGTGRGAGK